jgi:segregation and condensation protein B
MEEEKVKRIIEAILFATDKPLSMHRIKEVLEEVEMEIIKSSVSALKEEYESQGRSFRIVEVAGGIQLITDSQYAPWLKRLYRQDKPDKLSSPALETLAIIAYRQPVTRADIEFIRGVNVDGVIRGLLERGLIKIKGRKDTVGRPFVYGTTREFLECFGLNSLADLPKLKESDVVREDVLKEVRN